MRYLLASVALFLFASSPTLAATVQRPIQVAILDFGSSQFAKSVSQEFRAALAKLEGIRITDPDLSMSAARGAGYSGSLNLSISQARDLGASIDADFYLLGDAQTLRRSSFSKPVYYQTYLTVFIVSSRSGSLVKWDRIESESDSPENSERQLFQLLESQQTVKTVQLAIRSAAAKETAERQLDLGANAPLIEEAPDDDRIASEQGLRLPRPYRRLHPTYTQAAAGADVEAIVDVLVDIGADGEVHHIQVARWAGFGLDESTVDTVRQLHFFPAMRNGTPIPLRVLLRYNFRKPPQ
jgi:TonB family protein